MHAQSIKWNIHVWAGSLCYFIFARFRAGQSWTDQIRVTTRIKKAYEVSDKLFTWPINGHARSLELEQDEEPAPPRSLCRLPVAHLPHTWLAAGAHLPAERRPPPVMSIFFWGAERYWAVVDWAMSWYGLVEDYFGPHFVRNYVASSNSFV